MDSSMDERIGWNRYAQRIGCLWNCCCLVVFAGCSFRDEARFQEASLVSPPQELVQIFIRRECALAKVETLRDSISGNWGDTLVGKSGWSPGDLTLTLLERMPPGHVLVDLRFRNLAGDEMWIRRLELSSLLGSTPAGTATKRAVPLPPIIRERSDGGFSIVSATSAAPNSFPLERISHIAFWVDTNPGFIVMGLFDGPPGPGVNVKGGRSDSKALFLGSIHLDPRLRDVVVRYVQFTNSPLKARG